MSIPRVSLSNLFTRQGSYYDSCETLNLDRSQLSRRKHITYWFLQVAVKHNLTRETVSVAINFMDRYRRFSDCNKLIKLQLVAATCIYLSSKLNESQESSYRLKLADMCKEVNYHFNEDLFVVMEKELLSKLNWRMFPPTPYDFLRAIEPNVQSRQIIVTAETYVDACHHEELSLTCLPSEIALASVVAAFDMEVCCDDVGSCECKEVFLGRLDIQNYRHTPGSRLCLEFLSSLLAAMSLPPQGGSGRESPCFVGEFSDEAEHKDGQTPASGSAAVISDIVTLKRSYARMTEG